MLLYVHTSKTKKKRKKEKNGIQVYKKFTISLPTP